jgi:DNA recombination protein RmuC
VETIYWKSMSIETTVIILLAGVVLALASALLVLLSSQRKNRTNRSDPQALLGQQLGEMRSELGKVTDLVRDLERDRENKFGELTTRLRMVGEQTASLNSTTGALREALASTRVRGQWGERMAEDVLRLIGFVEGINYVQQKSRDGASSRPDFTFLLPRGLKLNMDVKFPLENYLRFTNSKDPWEKQRLRNAFLRDVRNRLREVVTRDYIDPEQSTLGCVLLFIPNEQIYQFIHEQDHSIIDDSLKSQVVLCSPMTLFAILAVVRQAVDNFTIEQTSHRIIGELGAFNKQWDEFVKKLDDLGRRIESAQREYQNLITTRRSALDRPLKRIEALRKQSGLKLPEDSAGLGAGAEVLPGGSDLEVSIPSHAMGVLETKENVERLVEEQSRDQFR